MSSQATMGHAGVGTGRESVHPKCPWGGGVGVGGQSAPPSGVGLGKAGLGGPSHKIALLELARDSEAWTGRLPKQGGSPRSRVRSRGSSRLRTGKEEAAASGATLTTALIHAARSRAASKLLEKKGGGLHRVSSGADLPGLRFR